MACKISIYRRIDNGTDRHETCPCVMDQHYLKMKTDNRVNLPGKTGQLIYFSHDTTSGNPIIEKLRNGGDIRDLCDSIA